MKASSTHSKHAHLVLRVFLGTHAQFPRVLKMWYYGKSLIWTRWYKMCSHVHMVSFCNLIGTTRARHQTALFHVCAHQEKLCCCISTCWRKTVLYYRSLWLPHAHSKKDTQREDEAVNHALEYINTTLVTVTLHLELLLLFSRSSMELQK